MERKEKGMKKREEKSIGNGVVGGGGEIVLKGRRLLIHNMSYIL